MIILKPILMWSINSRLMKLKLRWGTLKKLRRKAILKNKKLIKLESFKFVDPHLERKSFEIFSVHSSQRTKVFDAVRS